MELRPEFKLNNLPEDCISAVRFAPSNSQFLLASSWDQTLRLYDINSNTLRTKFYQEEAFLDCFLKDPTHGFAGSLDGTVSGFDFNSETSYKIGTHEDAVRCVAYNYDINAVVSGSWDTYVKIWDLRTNTPAAIQSQNEKEVYNMDLLDELLVVATAGRKVFLWDIRSMKEPLQKRDSILKYQTRCIRIFPNKQGFVLSSIEGRVAVEYFDLSPEEQKKKYAFKCHRTKEGGVEHIFPVNAISFHKGHKSFATGGSDSFVNTWDGFNKKRLCQFHRYPSGISSLAFNDEGNILAISCSYMYEYEEPPNPYPEDCIFIRYLSDQETKPKLTA